MMARQLRKHHFHALLTLAAFALFWAPVLIFASLADEVVEREPLPFDAPIQAVAHSVHSAPLTNIFLFMTSLGQPLAIGGAGVLVILLLVGRKYWREAAMVFAGLGGAVVANILLKYVFTRVRPTQYVSLLTETSYSFPSGHAMVSAAFAVTIIIVVWRTTWRVPALVVGILATLLIGLSRIYLGVHYPSDVLAGWSFGVIWAVITGSLILDRPFRIGRRLTPGRLRS